jgi:hypothetical protein
LFYVQAGRTIRVLVRFSQHICMHIHIHLSIYKHIHIYTYERCQTVKM